MNNFKVLYFGLVLACSVSGLQADLKDDFRIPEGLLELGGALTARAASWMVIHRLQTGNFRINNLGSEESKFITIPIPLPPLPPLPDPINIPSLEIPLNITGPDHVHGLVAFCAPRIEGLSVMHDDLVLDIDLLKSMFGFDMTFSIPSVLINSNYMANVYMNYTVGQDTEEVVFAGSGLSSFGLSNLNFTLSATLHAPISSGEKMSVPHLDFNIAFDKAFLIAEDLEMNDIPIPSDVLDNIAALFKTLFDLLLGQIKTPILESTRCSLDYAINDCVPLDLISGVLDCLKLDLNPDCFGSNGQSLVSAMESLAPKQGANSYCNPEESTTEGIQTTPTTAPTTPLVTETTPAETTPTTGQTTPVVTETTPAETTPTTGQTTPVVTETTPVESTTVAQNSATIATISTMFIGLIFAVLFVTYQDQINNFY